MKHYFIRKEDAADVTAWLIENVGKENVRWWFDSDPYTGQRTVAQNKWAHGSVVWLDVTEEELPMLTWFTMRWG